MISKPQTPQLRLTGFSKDWVQKKLVDEVIFFSGLTYTPSDVVDKSGTLVLRSSNVQNGAITLGDNVYVNSEVVNSQNVEVGDSIVVVRNGSRNLIGKHAMITKPMSNTVIGAFMTGIRAPVPSFFNTLLDTQEFHDEVSKNLGATINQITGGMFKAMSFYLPESDEQAAIGNLFQNIDQTIALQRRKHEQTQTLKKSLLSKMFPKKGQKQPEIRLAGFSGDWVETKLGDKGYCKSGIGFAINEQNGKVGIPFYKVSDMNLTGNEIIMNKARSYVTNDQVSHNKWSVFTELPSIIFAKVGAAVMLNRKRLILKEYLSDNNMMSYILGEEWDCYFCKLIFENIYLPNLSQVGALPSINARDVEGLMILIPDLKKEQTAIGQFFKQLDDTISLQAKQLKTLENLKKALLAKMFV